MPHSLTEWTDDELRDACALRPWEAVVARLGMPVGFLAGLLASLRGYAWMVFPFSWWKLVPVVLCLPLAFLAIAASAFAADAGCEFLAILRTRARRRELAARYRQLPVGRWRAEARLRLQRAPGLECVLRMFATTPWWSSVGVSEVAWESGSDATELLFASAPDATQPTRWKICPDRPEFHRHREWLEAQESRELGRLVEAIRNGEHGKPLGPAVRDAHFYEIDVVWQDGKTQHVRTTDGEYPADNPLTRLTSLLNRNPPGMEDSN